MDEVGEGKELGKLASMSTTRSYRGTQSSGTLRTLVCVMDQDLTHRQDAFHKGSHLGCHLGHGHCRE
jgi:hypothetical protein